MLISKLVTPLSLKPSSLICGIPPSTSSLPGVYSSLWCSFNALLHQSQASGCHSYQLAIVVWPYSPKASLHDGIWDTRSLKAFGDLCTLHSIYNRTNRNQNN